MVLFKKFFILILFIVFNLEINASINSDNVPIKIFNTNTLIIKNNKKIETKFRSNLLLNALEKHLVLYDFEIKNLDVSSNKQLQIEFNKTYKYNSNTIKKILNQTITSEIKKIIINTKSLQVEKNIITDSSTKLSFAETKGKSEALTANDLKYLLNKNFIYIPYINEFKTQQISEKDYLKKVKTIITGGVYWFQITTDTNNEISYKFIKDISINCNDASKWLWIDIYDEFAQTIKNSSKSIEQFKPKISIKSVINNKYTLKTNKFTKIKLGDEFLLKRYDLINNDIKITNKGLIQITNLNKDTQAVQRLGELQNIGVWAEAYPRLGIELNAGYSQFLNIYNKNVNVFSSRLTIPLVKYLNINDIYIFLNQDLSLMDIPINQTQNFEISIKQLNQWIIGLEKQYWIKSNSIGIYLGFGMQERVFGQRTKLSNWQYSWIRNEIGLSRQIGLSFQRPISVDWSIRAEINKSFSDRSYDSLLQSTDIKSINFNHTQISLSLYYKIPSLGLNGNGLSAKRTVSLVLDIGNMIYKSVKFIVKIMNSGSSYQENDKNIRNKKKIDNSKTNNKS